MIKKITFALLLLISILICFCIPASALNSMGQCGESVYYTYDKVSKTVNISGEGDMVSYDFPGSSVFDSSEFIENVIIEDGVTSIGNYTFFNCASLMRILLPDSVVSIGNGAFEGCYELDEIILPSQLNSIGSSAFAGCEGITKIIMPHGINELPSYAFSDCTELTDIIFLGELNALSANAFRGCNKLEMLHCLSNGESLSASVTQGIPKQTAAHGAYGVKIIKDCETGETVEGLFCNICNDFVYSESYIDTNAIGDHTEIIDKEVPPTCTETGLTEGKHCEVCKKVISEQSIVSSNGHKYNSVVTAPTCTEKGYTTYTCECDDSYIDDYVEAEGHSYLSTVITPATHLKEGVRSYTCSACGDSYSEPIAKLKEHSYSVVVIAPKCKTGGYTRYTCDCGYTYDSNFESPKGHTYTSKTTKAPTCTATGVKTFTCKCGDTYTDTVKKLEHSYSKDYTVDKKATCTQVGAKSKHCTRNGCTAKTDVVEIAKLKHTEVKIKAKASTCTKTGLTEGKKCSVCSTVTVKQKTVAKKAHSYKTASTTKATLSKNGKVIKICSGCSHKITEAVYYPKTIKLSKTSYAYTGKEKNPSVTVKDSKGNTLKKDKDYTVKHEGGRKNTGRYTVTVTFKGKYSGTKKLNFTIAPKATGKLTASQSTTTVTLKWNKVTGATGYAVYQYKSGEWKKIKDLPSGKTLSYKVEKLKAGTAYKFRIKAYKKDDGTIWGSAKDISTATKPSTPKITKLTATKGKANLTWSNVSGESGYEIYFSTKKDKDFKSAGSFKADVTKGSKSKLTSGKTYYFKVRAYKTVGGSKICSAWSAVKSVKIK